MAKLVDVAGSRWCRFRDATMLLTRAFWQAKSGRPQAPPPPHERARTDPQLQRRRFFLPARLGVAAGALGLVDAGFGGVAAFGGTQWLGTRP